MAGRAPLAAEAGGGPATDAGAPGGWSRELAVILAIAVVARLLWLLTRVETIQNEGAEYARIADSLRHGDGYRGLTGATELVFPPVYPLLTAAASYLAGGVELGARLVSLVMGSALVLPVHAIARRVHGRTVALAAAGLVALHPVLVAMSTSTFSEPTFITLVATGAYLLVRAHQERRLHWGLAAGTLLALATLTRPEGAVYVAVLGGGALAVGLARPGRRRDTLVVSAGLAVAFAAVVAPYIAFVSSELGTFSATGKAGINYAIADRMRKGLSHADASHGIDADLTARGPLLDPNRFADDAVDSNPVDAARYLASNARVQQGPLRRLLLRSTAYGSPLVALLAVVGLVAGPWTGRRLRGDAALAAAGLAALLVLFSVRWFQYRFGFPLLVLLLIWAARGLVVLADRVTPVTARTALARFVPALPFLLALPVLALSLAGTATGAVGQRTFGQPGSPTVVEKRAGLWLRHHGGPEPTVMSLSAIVPFYAGATWQPLPYTDEPAVLVRWIDRHRPRFVVLGRDPARPSYVARWVAAGLPDPSYRPVYRTGTGARELRVFRLTTTR